jgi:hypothetical protein
MTENSPQWNDKFRVWVEEKHMKITDIVKYLADKGITAGKSTIGDYIKGNAKTIRHKNVADALAEWTGIVEISEAYGKKQKRHRRSVTRQARKDHADKGLTGTIEDKLRELYRTAEALKLGTGKNYQPTIEEKTAAFIGHLNNAVRISLELTDYFRDHRGDIPALTKAIQEIFPRENAGYLAGIINAIYDPQRFKDHVLLSQFKVNTR